jgi:hypothetical protein
MYSRFPISITPGRLVKVIASAPETRRDGHGDGGRGGGCVQRSRPTIRRLAERDQRSSGAIPSLMAAVEAAPMRRTERGALPLVSEDQTDKPTPVRSQSPESSRPR